jgi:hypothetical protein
MRPHVTARRTLSVLTASAFTVALVQLVAAGPAAAETTCSVSGGILTVTVNSDNGATLSADSATASVIVTEGSSRTSCATGRLGALDGIDVTAHDSLGDADYTIDFSTPFRRTAGGLVPIHVASPTLVRLDSYGETTGAHVAWATTSTATGFDLDADGTPDVTGLDGTFLAVIVTGDKADVVNLTGYWGPATLNTLGGNDTITDGSGPDTIDSGSGDDNVRATNEGQAQVFPDLGDDTVRLGPVGDTVELGRDDGADTVTGVRGDNDTVVFTLNGSDDPINVSENGVADDGPPGEGDNINAVDHVVTGDGPDVVDARGIAWVESRGGDDVVYDANGDNQIDTGAGDDTVDFSHLTVGIGATLDATGGGVGTEQSTTPHSDWLAGVEHLVGTPHADTITLDCACSAQPGGSNDTVDLGANGTFLADATADGADRVTGSGSGATASYAARTAGVSVTLDGDSDDGYPGEGDDIDPSVHDVVGGSGADTIVGSSAANDLVGGDGNDVVMGRGGPDTVDGGAGNDQVMGNGGDDTVLGSDGADTLNGGDGDDVLRGDTNGGAGYADTLIGGNGDDDEYGYAGNDVFDEGSAHNGSDLLIGGTGADTASYANRTTAVRLSIDGLFNDGAPGEDDKIGSDVEWLVGGSGNDTLTGSNAANKITGGGGTDAIFGLGGNDTLISLDGVVDHLHGGAGTDRAHRDDNDVVTSVESRY